METAGIEFFNRVRNGYLEIAKQEPERVKVLNAAKSIDEVFSDLLNIIKPLI